MLNKIFNRVRWTLENLPYIREQRECQAIQKWLLAGKPGPTPHAVKQANLRQLQRRFKLPTLVETGTFRGDMMIAMSPFFEHLYSIELSPDLFRFSQEKCSGLQNVTIKQGASEDVLAEICRELQGPVLFWLDGHYSGGDTAQGATECPVPTELRTILSYSQITPIIVIDDAREFVGHRSYPTVAEVAECLCESDRRMHVSVYDDAIVSIPDALLRR